MSILRSRADLNTQLTFESLGLTSREREVLACVTRLSMSNTPITLNLVTEVLRSISNNTISHNWVYKCLRRLERLGLVKVDRLRRPNCYVVNDKIIRDGTRKNWVQVAKELRERISQLEADIDLLKSVRASHLASYLYRRLRGTTYSDRTHIIHGETAVRVGAVRGMIASASHGAIIRVCHNIDAVSAMVDLKENVSELLMFCQSKDLEFRLMTILDDENIDAAEERIRSLISHNEQLRDVVACGRVQIRVYPHSASTYRMICVGNERMMLYLSTVYPTERVLMVEREDCGYMIDDAIRTFDRLWQASIDVRV